MIALKFLNLFKRYRKHQIAQELTQRLAPAILTKSTSGEKGTRLLLFYGLTSLQFTEILETLTDS